MEKEKDSSERATKKVREAERVREEDKKSVFEMEVRNRVRFKGQRAGEEKSGERLE